MADFIGFGALNVDRCYEVSPTFFGSTQHGRETEGRTESLSSLLKRLEREKLLFRSGGGSAANTTVALAGMGVDTGYVGKVGNDEDGEFLLDSLTGVDTSHVLRGDAKSGLVLALQTEDNRDTSSFVFSGDNDTITFDEIDIDYLNGAKVVHLTSFVGDQSFEAQSEALQRLHPDVFVSFDGGELYARRGLPALAPFLRRSNIIFPSREEVRLLTNEEDPIKGAEILSSYGPDIVCVTLDKDGCYVLTKDESFLAPAVSIPEDQIEHTIGAGDVFAAGFLAGMFNGKSLRECAGFANQVAAKSITGAGRERYPTRDDLREFLHPTGTQIFPPAN